MTSSFQPAVKAQLKARVALDGPTGSGKTWTALEFATVLAGQNGRIAFIDTERDSARLYANRFKFDVVRFDPPYQVERLVELLREAESAGYDVIVADSLSHFWEGEGGVLDEVEAAARRDAGGNKFAGWKHGTPLQRWMVDTFLSLDAHVVVTMRSKMEYVLEENDRGQKVPKKVGMAPVQRGGLEYEFTLVGDLDLEHRITITKSRCDALADLIVQPNRAGEAAAQFLDWLNDGTPPPELASPEQLTELAAGLRALGRYPQAYKDARYPVLADLDAMALRARQPITADDAAHALEIVQAEAGRGGEAAPGPGGGDEPDVPGQHGPGVSDAPLPSAGGDAGDREEPAPAHDGAPSSPPASSAPDETSKQRAQQIAMRCNDAGLDDTGRHEFLEAFSRGAYSSAKDVPADALAPLFAALVKFKRGEVRPVRQHDGVLWLVDTNRGDFGAKADAAQPQLAEAGPWGKDRWEAELASVPGIGAVKLLRKARDLATGLGVDAPGDVDAITDPGLVEALLGWLNEQRAAAA